MKSTHITHLISDFVDGRLDHGLFEKVKSHLIFCKGCRNHLNEVEENIATLKSLPSVPPPDGLEIRIINAMKSALANPNPNSQLDPTPHTPWYQVFLSGKGLALAATAAVMVVFVVKGPFKTELQDPKKIDRLSKIEDKIIDSKVVRLKEKPVTNNLKTERKKEIQKPREVQEKPQVDRRVIQPRSSTGKKSNLKQVTSAFSGGGLGVASEAAPNLVSSNRPTVVEAFDRDQRERGLLTKDIDNKQFSGIQGHISGVSEPLEAIINNQQQWDDLWQKHAKNQPHLGPAPYVDFEKQQIIAVFAGNRGSGGYLVDIIQLKKSTWKGATARVVTYKINQPNPQSISTTVITQPFSIIATSRSTTPIIFNKIR